MFDDFFRDAPPSVDVAAIRREWQAVAPGYDVNRWRLPLPVWAQRPYEDSGSLAWETLRNDLTAADPNRPLCIYLHAPFCSSKCGFCDSYSFKLDSHKAGHIEGYVDRLCYELSLWSEQGNLRQRPVSTVHMGGGTPTFLGEAALARVVESCKACFNISPATEWALESTIEGLTPNMVATMHDLGYRRLHLGVQSLQARTRAEIGRRCSPAEVLDRVGAALARGWILSVDMVCGLPYQTLAGWVADIETLIAAGVDGFSLYELLIYPQNQRWAESHSLTGRSHLPNYFMFQAGASVLAAHGFGKNLFNHWADARDANLYFTFPTRGEDCLAIGTIADGVFGDYHYRHPRYAPYLRAVGAGQPGLEGGLRRTAFENRLQPLTTALLSGHIPPGLCAGLRTPSGEPLVERWQDYALVEADPGGGLRLTTSGAWFTGNLIAELAGQGQQRRDMACA